MRPVTLQPLTSVPCAVPRPRAGGRQLANSAPPTVRRAASPRWRAAVAWVALTELDHRDAAKVAALFMPDQPVGPPIPALDGQMQAAGFFGPTWLAAPSRTPMRWPASHAWHRPGERPCWLASSEGGVMANGAFATMAAQDAEYRARFGRDGYILPGLPTRAEKLADAILPLAPIPRPCRGATWSSDGSTGGLCRFSTAKAMSATLGHSLGPMAFMPSTCRATGGH